MYPSEKKHIELIHGLAVKAFAEHQITVRLNQGRFRNYQCHRPGTSCYLFNVTFEPWRLIVSGDIGFMAWEREEDMLKDWTRSAIHSIDYFASKIPSDIKREAFCSDVARDWLADQEEEWRRELAEDELSESRLKKLQDRLDEIDTVRGALDDGEHYFTDALLRSGLIDGGHYPDFSTWTSSFLWCREAMLWFLPRVDDAGNVIVAKESQG